MGAGAASASKRSGSEQKAVVGGALDACTSPSPTEALSRAPLAEDYDFPYSDQEDRDEDHIVDDPDDGADLPSPRLEGDPPQTSRGHGGDRMGAIWHAQIVSDDFNSPQHCTLEGNLKPHRPMPHIRISELIKNLEEVNGGCYHRGPLNEWPALTNLELRSLTKKVRSKLGTPTIKRLWDAGSGKDLLTILHELQTAPAKMPKSLRGTFRGEPWTLHGWSKASPGFVYWYYLPSEGKAAVCCGEHMCQVMTESCRARGAQATHAHVVAHRYPTEKQSLKDRLLWHTIVLLEWSHGLHMTVVEFAWWNGVGGYGGKSNWCEDKLSKPPALYTALFPSMKAPWNQDRGEIRCIDMPVTSKEEFQQYLDQYSGKSGLPIDQQRFLEPRLVSSEPVRLSHRTPPDIARFLLNYVAKRGHYDEQTCNCQTFTADFFGFLAGKQDCKPFSEFLRLQYKHRPHLFLYDVE